MGRELSRAQPRRPSPALPPIVGEPTIDEVLGDPIVRLMMARDRVGVAEIEDLIARVRIRCGTVGHRRPTETD